MSHLFRKSGTIHLFHLTKRTFTIHMDPSLSTVATVWVMHILNAITRGNGAQHSNDNNNAVTLKSLHPPHL